MNTTTPQRSLVSISKTLAEVATIVDGEVVGDKDIQIRGLCSLDEPIVDCLSFVSFFSDRVTKQLQQDLRPAAILVAHELMVPDSVSLPVIMVKHPLAALIQLVPSFFPAERPLEGIHETAVIDPTASLGKNVTIGPFTWIGAHARIGDNTQVLSHVAIYPHAQIGSEALIHSHSVIREYCVIGSGGVIQNGAVVGSDGFGYIPDATIGVRQIPQIGRVELGDRVDIGANSCIDRATLGTTRIGESSKLDNLVQVGHNTKVGKYSILCGQVGVAGSCDIGDGVTIGGATGIADHLSIASGCRVAGKSGVTNHLQKKGDYAGYPAVPANDWRKAQVALRRLPEMRKTLKELKKKLKS